MTTFRLCLACRRSMPRVPGRDRTAVAPPCPFADRKSARRPHRDLSWTEFDRARRARRLLPWSSGRPAPHRPRPRFGRRSGVSRLSSRATASPGESEPEEPVGRRAWKSSKATASGQVPRTLARLRMQPSRASGRPPSPRRSGDRHPAASTTIHSPTGRC